MRYSILKRREVPSRWKKIAGTGSGYSQNFSSNFIPPGLGVGGKINYFLF
jgi:hypothetical protein